MENEKWLIGTSTGTPSSITFNTNNTEVFRITAEGALVKGERMSDDDCTNALFEAISQGMVKKVTDLRARAETAERQRDDALTAKKRLEAMFTAHGGRYWEARWRDEEVRAIEAERQRDEAKALVIEANNSLYGSQNYFTSLDGSKGDKWHLARGIEDLKERNRQLSRQRDEAFAKGAEAMREACAMAAWMIGMGFGMDESDARACATAIRALPIPTQEVK